MKKPYLDKTERFMLKVYRENPADYNRWNFIKDYEIQEAKRDFGRAIQKTYLYVLLKKLLNT